MGQQQRFFSSLFVVLTVVSGFGLAGYLDYDDYGDYGDYYNPGDDYGAYDDYGEYDDYPSDKYNYGDFKRSTGKSFYGGAWCPECRVSGEAKQISLGDWDYSDRKAGKKGDEEEMMLGNNDYGFDDDYGTDMWPKESNADADSTDNGDWDYEINGEPNSKGSDTISGKKDISVDDSDYKTIEINVGPKKTESEPKPRKGEMRPRPKNPESSATTESPSYDDTALHGFNSSTWPHGIAPYYIDRRFENFEKRRIESVLKEINQRSVCVHFRPKHREDADYLNFTRRSWTSDSKDEPCRATFIGYVAAGSQEIYLSRYCTSTAPLVYWGVLQSLGMPAEHMRPDRDKYIKVLWENVDPRYVVTFKKYSFIDPRLARLPYDLKSRLHYTSDKHSVKAGLKTVVAKESESLEIGNRLAPTYLDYQKVKALYCENGADLPASGIPTSLARSIRLDPNLYQKCQCFDAPHPVTGTCAREGGFQFKDMWKKCRRSDYDDVCKCEDLSRHACWCEPAPDASCKYGNRCPKTRCVKHCRFSES